LIHVENQISKSKSHKEDEYNLGTNHQTRWRRRKRSYGNLT
jgi:hypothetical protein